MFMLDGECKCVPDWGSKRDIANQYGKKRRDGHQMYENGPFLNFVFGLDILCISSSKNTHNGTLKNHRKSIRQNERAIARFEKSNFSFVRLLPAHS